MPRGEEQLQQAIREALEPSLAELTRARRELRRILADGRPHGVRELQTCLTVADGVSAPGGSIAVTSAAGIAAATTPTTPLLVWHRLILAASDALVDQVAQGAVTPVAEVLGVEPNSELTRSLTLPGTVSIPYQLDGHSSRVSIRPPLPDFAPGYRLAPGLREYAQHWFLDPDLFVADLDALSLDLRTARAIGEAIRAFRVGLYLAAINLLGAASEGAWYAAGEALRHLDSRLARALDEDRTAEVIALVAEVLKHDRAIASEVPGLVAQAELHRYLRNYGVHPRPDADEFAERYLSESGTALLLIEDYAYLQRLSAALRSRLKWTTGGSEAAGDTGGPS